MSNHTKVLFICKKRSDTYGAHTKSIGLYNSAKFIVNFLQKHHIGAKVDVVNDSNDIDKIVHHYKPTHVVLHALWVPPYKIEELIKKYSNIHWQVRIHSKIPFLANEGMALDWIIHYKPLIKKYRNLELITNSSEAQFDLAESLDMQVGFLANIYQPDTPPPSGICEHSDEYINVGCLGAIRPFKNQLIQAMAAIRFGNEHNKDIHFHVNSDRTEQAGDQVLKNLRSLFSNSNHKLIEHSWVPHDKFLKLVNTMDIGMQVSMSETFNIVAADFVYTGIPIIVSKEIDWMPITAISDSKHLKEMCQTLEFNYRKEYRERIVKENLEHLHYINRVAEEQWLLYLLCCC